MVVVHCANRDPGIVKKINAKHITRPVSLLRIWIFFLSIHINSNIKRDLPD